MKFSDYITGSIEYIIKYLRSVKPPKIGNDEIVADLHAHHTINSTIDLYKLFDSMIKHNVDLIAITRHITAPYKNYRKNEDFWYIKDLIKKENSSMELGYKDLGIAFRIIYKNKLLTFVGSYEVEIILDKHPHFRHHMLTLMPDKGFEDHVKYGMDFKDYIELSRRYNAIIIAAHPYTVHDHSATNRFLRFMIPPEEYRKQINDAIFTVVDSVDCTAANIGWLIRSNELVKNNFRGKPLSTSDTHSDDFIGCSGTIFKLVSYSDGNGLRSELRKSITSNDFTTYDGTICPFYIWRKVILHLPKEAPIRHSAYKFDNK
ncbi:MAG: hypothetical protein KAJ47_01215 [Candidatus Aenigmarchaeota archaeon]|nr:hypothetical protein [Candidatus Aenigmarchaeota archaeon]